MGQGENTHVKAKLTERDEHEVSLLYSLHNIQIANKFWRNILYTFH